MEDVDRASWAATFFCLGIWAFEAQMVILRVYFVLKDTRTPTVISICMIVLNFALNLTLVWPLREGGIALSTTIAAILQGAILLFILRKRLGSLGVKALLKNVGLSILVTALMVEAGVLLWIIPLPWEHGGLALSVREKLLTACVKLPLLVGACAGIYVGLTAFLNMPEVGDLPVIGRFALKLLVRFKARGATKS